MSPPELTRRLLVVALATMAAPMLAVAPAGAAPAVTPYPTTSAGARASEWWLSKLGIEQAWKTTRGAGVTIASIDSGVDPSTEELAPALVPGADMSAGRGAPNGQKPVPARDMFGKFDDGSHGTATATLAVGRGRGAGGTIGVAPEAKLMPISIFFDGLSKFDPKVESECDRGIKYAADHGAKIISLSLSANCTKGAVGYAQRRDVVLVAAAGNDGDILRLEEYSRKKGLLGVPADTPGVVAVSGVNRGLDFASQSSYGGANYVYGNQLAGAGVGLAAPFEVDENVPIVVSSINHQYVPKAGTSLGTPIVAGMAALIRSAYPKMPAQDVIARLLVTATVPGHPPLPDPRYGFGVPDVDRALRTDTPHLSANPLGDVASGAVRTGVWGADGLNVFAPPKGTIGSREYATSGGTSSSAAGRSGSGSVAAPDSGETGSRAFGIALFGAAGLLVVVVGFVLLRRRGRPSRAGYPVPPPWQQPPPHPHQPPQWDNRR